MVQNTETSLEIETMKGNRHELKIERSFVEQFYSVFVSYIDNNSTTMPLSVTSNNLIIGDGHLRVSNLRAEPGLNNGNDVGLVQGSQCMQVVHFGK